MPWSLDVTASPDGTGERWVAQVLNNGGNLVARIVLPEPILRMVNRIRNQRPTPQTMQWTVTIPVGFMIPKVFFKIAGLVEALRAPPDLWDEDE